MNIYTIIKWYHRINSPRLKALGMLVMHYSGRRYLNISIDPSLNCNLRCLMCYLSDPENARNAHGQFTDEDVQHIAKAVFHRALKLQIGCGAEPTLYKGLDKMVLLAHQYGVPNISITTNGNLLTRESMLQLAKNGLNEIVISAHGLEQETYEHMMRNGRFDKFTQLIAGIGETKRQYPGLQLRINYTICQDNLESLRHFQEVFADVKPDIIQLRPVQDIGSTAYTNYAMDEIIAKYDDIIVPLVEYCKANGITCLYPERENIRIIDQENMDKKHVNTAVDTLPYLYMSPYKGWKEEFNPYEESFEDYAKRTRRTRRMVDILLHPNHSEQEESSTKLLNYTVK